MEAVKRLHASGLLHGEWEPTAEAAAQAAYHMRAAAAVEFDLRALYDADDRAAAMEKSRSSSPDATPGTTSGAISSASRKHAAVTQSNNTTGVPETLQSYLILYSSPTGQQTTGRAMLATRGASNGVCHL